MPIPVTTSLPDNLLRTISVHGTCKEADAMQSQPSQRNTHPTPPAGPLPHAGASRSAGKQHGKVQPKVRLTLPQERRAAGERARPPRLSPAGTLARHDCIGGAWRAGTSPPTGMQLQTQGAEVWCKRCCRIKLTCSHVQARESPREFPSPRNRTTINKCKWFHLCFLHDAAL